MVRPAPPGAPPAAPDTKPPEGALGVRPPRPRLLRLGRVRPLVVAAALVAAVAVVAAVFAEQLAPYDPLAPNLAARLSPPGGAHPLGTDNFGRDVLSRVIYGARVSVLVGLASAGLAFLFGTAAGFLSGLLGGPGDLAGQRAIDTLLAFPALVLALVFVAAFGPSTGVVIAAISTALFPQMARLARSLCLAIKESDYCLAARAMGASRWHIALRHILPNALGSLVALATGFVGESIVIESVLSYLGLGVPPPTPSWGRMISEGSRRYLETAPWLTIVPGLALSLLALAFAILGDAVRDALDPKK